MWCAALLALVAFIAGISAAPVNSALEINDVFALSHLPDDVKRRVLTFVPPRELIYGIGRVDKPLRRMALDPTVIVGALKHAYAGHAFFERVANGRLPQPSVWSKLIDSSRAITNADAEHVLRGVAKNGDMNAIAQIRQKLIEKQSDLRRRKITDGAYLGAAEAGNLQLIQDLTALAPMRPAIASRMAEHAAKTNRLDVFRHLSEHHNVAEEGLALAATEAAIHRHHDLLMHILSTTEANDELFARAAIRSADVGAIDSLRMLTLANPMLGLVAYSHAARTGNLAMMREIERFKHLVDSADWPCAALFFASPFGQVDVVRDSLERCNDVDLHQDSIDRAYILSFGAHAPDIRALLDSFTSLSEQKKDLFGAIDQGDVERLTLALDALESTNQLDNPVGNLGKLRHVALFCAAAVGRGDLLNALEDRLADGTFDPRPLEGEGAVFRGNINLLMELERHQPYADFADAGANDESVQLTPFEAYHLDPFAHNHVIMQLIQLTTLPAELLDFVYRIMPLMTEQCVPDAIALCHQYGLGECVEKLKQFQTKFGLH